MTTTLASYVKSVRASKGLRPVDLARQMGLWKNPSKGAQRITDFENGGAANEQFFLRLSDVLELDESKLREIDAQEAQQYQAWLDEPVPMELVIRWLPGFYASRTVPPGLSREEAMAWAIDQARELKRLKVCLRLSRRERLWIEEGGEQHRFERVERGAENVPYMKIGGQAVRFQLGSGDAMDSRVH